MLICHTGNTENTNHRLDQSLLWSPSFSALRSESNFLTRETDGDGESGAAVGGLRKFTTKTFANSINEGRLSGLSAGLSDLELTVNLSYIFRGEGGLAVWVQNY